MSKVKPKTTSCGGCTQQIITNETMKCTKCNLIYHYECVPMGYSKYSDIKKDVKTSWICPTCNSTLPKVGNSNTPIRCPVISGQQITKGTHADDCNSNITMRRKESKSPILGSQVTLDDIKNIFQTELVNLENKILNIINTKTKDLFTEISNINESMMFINRQYEDFKCEITDKFKDIKTLQDENQHLKTTISDLQKRLSLMEQYSRSNNVEIQCIPEHKSENLIKTVLQISKVTGTNIKEENIHKCTRVAKLNPNISRPRSLVVAFSSPRLRDAFMAGVIKFNKCNEKDKLNSSHIGIGGEKKPIFVTDHLTPAMKALHAAARVKAREKNFKFVWIKNGRVFIRKTESSDHVLVRSMETLADL